MVLRGTARVNGGISGVSLDIARELKDNLPYAKYIVFGGGNFTVAREAVLTEINSDVTRGELYARYSAGLGADEFGGEKVDFIGLSADGENLVCKAEFPPAAVQAGKPFTAEISVYLGVADDSDKVLCGGDNPLVRFLLGSRALPSDAFAAEGDCDAYNEFLSRDFPCENKLPASAKFVSGGVEVSAQVSPDANEVCLFFGESPALRTYLHGTETETLMIPSAEVFSDGCADVSVSGAEKLVYCAGANGNYADAVLVKTPDKIYRLKNALGFYAGRGAEIKTDEQGMFAAIGGKREIMLISGESGLPKYLFSVSREDGEDFAVCSGGCLFKIGEKITLCRADGTSVEYGVSGGEDNAVSRDGNAFHFARLLGGRVDRFLLGFDGEATELPSLSFGGDVKLFRNLFRIGVCSDEKCYILSRYAGESSEFEFFRSRRLEEIANRAGGVSNVRLGGGLALLTENGQTVAAAVDAESEFIAGGEKEDAVLFGDYIAFRSEGGAGEEIKVFDRGKRVLRDVRGYEDGKITGAGRVGDYLLALSGDGKAEIYYGKSGGAFAYCPSAAAGEKVRLGVRARVSGIAGKEKVNVKFAVSVG